MTNRKIHNYIFTLYTTETGRDEKDTLGENDYVPSNESDNAGPGSGHCQLLTTNLLRPSSVFPLLTRSRLIRRETVVNEKMEKGLN